MLRFRYQRCGIAYELIDTDNHRMVGVRYSRKDAERSIENLNKCDPVRFGEKEPSWGVEHELDGVKFNDNEILTYKD